MDTYPFFSERGQHYIAEMAFALGPEHIGVGNTYEVLFGRKWAAITNRKANRIELWQYSGSEWQYITPITDAPHSAKQMRHIALAFDQAGQPVFAYEVDGDNKMYVRQWEANTLSFVYRGPFNGVDPVLVMDAEANKHVADSDALLFYLNTSRREIKMRAQRDSYGTEYNVFDLGQPAFLDQGVVGSLRVYLTGSYQSAPTVTGFNVVTGLYPFRQGLTIALDPQWSGGEYREVVHKAESYIILNLDPQWAGGEYTEVVHLVDNFIKLNLDPQWTGGAYESVGPPIVEQTFSLHFDPQWTGGLYKAVVTKYGPNQFKLNLDPQWSGGEYLEVAVQYNQTMKLNLDPQWTGGSYEQA